MSRTAEMYTIGRNFQGITRKVVQGNSISGLVKNWVNFVSGCCRFFLRARDK
jgi:hypothetical protein